MLRSGRTASKDEFSKSKDSVPDITKRVDLQQKSRFLTSEFIRSNECFPEVLKSVRLPQEDRSLFIHPIACKTIELKWELRIGINFVAFAGDH